MFCAFDRPALIVRLYGHGAATLPQDAGWDEVAQHFTIETGVRQIFDIAVDSVQTSCGYAVPFMTFDRERQTLRKHYAPTTPEGNLERWQSRTRSIDGLPTRPFERGRRPNSRRWPSRRECARRQSRLMGLVVVETLFDRIAGEIARARLETAGIGAELFARRHRLGHRRRPLGGAVDARRRGRRGGGAGTAR